MHTPDEWDELIRVLETRQASAEVLDMAVWAREQGDAYPTGASAGWAEAIWRVGQKWVAGHPVSETET